MLILNVSLTMFAFSKCLYLSIFMGLADVSRDRQLFMMVLQRFEQFFHERQLKNHPDCWMKAKVL